MRLPTTYSGLYDGPMNAADNFDTWAAGKGYTPTQQIDGDEVVLRPGIDYEVSTCPACGNDEHTATQLAACMNEIVPAFDAEVAFFADFTDGDTDEAEAFVAAEAAAATAGVTFTVLIGDDDTAEFPVVVMALAPGMDKSFETSCDEDADAIRFTKALLALDMLDAGLIHPSN